MELEATAQALVTETALPEQVAAPTETESEPDYAAAYDKATGDAEDTPAEAAEAPAEAPEAPEAPAPAAPAVEAPTDVPVALRKHWSTLPEDAREAVLSSQREMSRKLSDMGRQVHGLEPIKSVLIGAVKELPALANMRPEEVAAEVVQLARISADFKSKPLETFIGLARQHGMVDALRQALGGQPQEAQQTATLQSEIRALKQQLSRASDPEFIREQVSAVTTQERVMSEVQAFAAQQEHWAEVEAFMPQIIPVVRETMPGASGKDVLAQAYQFAIQLKRPDLKAPAQAAVEAAAPPDPERAKAAIQAKSVNVTGRTTGKPREMTETEIYAAAYDRAARK